MAVLMLPWTPCSTRYFAAPAMASAGSYTLATPSPLASVATPATASDAGWTGAPPQVSPPAPRMRIGMGPAAPNAFDPLCTPGRLDRPSLLSTSPIPASTAQGTPYWAPNCLKAARQLAGMEWPAVLLTADCMADPVRLQIGRASCRER